MSQYTFSFLRSEYDRIPYQLKKDFAAILENSKADEESKKLMKDICESLSRAVADMSKYAQDQLKIW